MLSYLILLAVAVTIRADGYGAPLRGSISPAAAPYGAPYSSNQVVALPQQATQQQQVMQPQPLIQPQQVMQQYQPYTTSFTQQPIPIGAQQVGLPMGYSMYSNMPQQQNQNPFQIYERPPVSSPVYVNYPQGMIIQPQQPQQPQQHALQQQQTSNINHQQTAALPTAGTAFLTSSGYGNQPSTSSTSSTGPYFTSTTSTSAEIGVEEKGTTLSANAGLTPAIAPSVDPWASLSASIAAKKIETRKKKNSDGI
ncbi:hypothetical protein GCK32_003889 [Trichostrongylus colubriformis]|uniref:Uncharacterized protein n=1 Tax=Trichostrongylus colubriformis TaxID=6319 RepID=A0AAN8IDI3_TRICO